MRRMAMCDCTSTEDCIACSSSWICASSQISRSLKPASRRCSSRICSKSCFSSSRRCASRDFAASSARAVFWLAFASSRAAASRASRAFVRRPSMSSRPLSKARANWSRSRVSVSPSCRNFVLAPFASAFSLAMSLLSRTSRSFMLDILPSISFAFWLCAPCRSRLTYRSRKSSSMRRALSVASSATASRSSASFSLRVCILCIQADVSRSIATRSATEPRSIIQYRCVIRISLSGYFSYVKNIQKLKSFLKFIAI